MVTHDFPNLPPSVCFVCEGAEPGAVFVDTFRKFDPGFNTHLNGRKYVCSHCITDLAHHIGAFDGERERFQAEIVHLRELVTMQDNALSDYAALDAAVRRISEKPEKPAPEKKVTTNPTRMSSAAKKKAVKPAAETVDAR